MRMDSQVCECDVRPSAEDAGAFLQDVSKALLEWLSRNEPVSRKRFDDIQRLWSRSPGQPFQIGSEKAPKIRELDEKTLGEFACSRDIPVVEVDDGVKFADLHGFPIEEDEDGREYEHTRYIPIVVALDCDHEDVKNKGHAYYHVLTDLVGEIHRQEDSTPDVLTDGGKVENETCYAPDPMKNAASDLQTVIDTLLSDIQEFYSPTEYDDETNLDWDRELATKKAALRQFKAHKLISPQQYARLITQIEDEYAGDVNQTEIASPKVVIKEHQGVGKTRETIRQCIAKGMKFVYCSQDHDTLSEKQRETTHLSQQLLGSRLTTRLVRGENKECDDLVGRNGRRAMKDAEALKHSGVHHGLRKKITDDPDYHYNAQCSLDGNLCTYDQQFEDIDEVAGIFAHPKMLHRDDLSEDRVVILDESAINYFITEIGDIRSAVRQFCTTVEMPEGLRTYGQLVNNDLSGVEVIRAFRQAAIDTRLEWQKEQDYDIRYNRETIREYLLQNPKWTDRVLRTPSSGHLEIGAVVYSLLFSNQQVNGFVHERIDPGHEVLVRPEGAKILNIPDFSSAAAVIGLDATARESIWNKFILPGSDIVELRSDEERRELAEACNLSITRVGDNAYHGDGGNLSAEYIKGIKRIADEVEAPAATFGTKTYHELDAVDYYFNLHDKAVNMGELELLVMAMAPHPGDRALEEIAAWFDIRLGPESRIGEGPDLRYENKWMSDDDRQTMDDILRYFREDKIEQAIFRGLRPHNQRHTGLRVLTLTSCLPDWMPVSEEIEAPTQRVATQEKYIAKAMKALEEPTLRRIQAYIRSEFDIVVTQQRVHQFKEKHEDILSIEQWEEDGRAYVYILNKLPDIAKDSVEQISNSIGELEFVPDSGVVDRVSTWIAGISEFAKNINGLTEWLLKTVPKLEGKGQKTAGVG